MPVFGVRQQQAGEECTEGHRHADFVHQPRGAHHHQQGGGRGDFRQVGLGDDAKHRAQQVTATDHHHGDAAQYPQAMIEVLGRAGAVVDAGQQRDHGDQRDRRDVLEQQDGKRQPPVGAGQLLALGQALQAEGGGRQRQPQAEHDGTVERLAKGVVRQHPDH
ncbi:hypothetical protein D3C78_1147190 [compost metagenome]